MKRCHTVLIDSHCHLFMPEFDLDRPQALSRARAAGVTSLLVIGYDLASSREVVFLADREDGVFACVAIHDREAHTETMRILAEGAEEIPAAVLHCFSGDRAMASEAWARGYYTAAGGPITCRAFGLPCREDRG